MLSSLFGRLRVAKTLVVITRNKKETAATPPPTKINREATDPVQKLFLEKLREYRQKSSGSKLVDASPDILKELDKEYKRLNKAFGGGPGVDMVSFPTFKFEDPVLDSIDELSPEEKRKKKKEKEEKRKKKEGEKTKKQEKK